MKVSVFQKMPQSRARRCSFSAAVASFSMSPRSHCPSLSVIVHSLQEDLAVALLDSQRHEWRASAGAAEALSTVRRVGGTVRRAYQFTSVGIEDFTFAPVELHGQVTAAVQVPVHATTESDHERRRLFTEILDEEAHREAGVGQCGRLADQPFVVSHCRNSST